MNLNSINNTNAHLSIGGFQHEKKQAVVNPAAKAFTSYMIEKTLNCTISENALNIDGSHKSRGEVLAQQMMNRKLADIIANESSIAMEISKELKK
ncbi:hypothetical protein [Photobacterium kishitanii]|uniref:Uncharacterized protein n=1 Tax=Photobacterium kishitanii TaxID=318456 RepID=A0A2T3KMZ5_9GAMM|nr:hypothetical protein [Photobacterium kishitanii]PSV01115.1 hypothetical protein C9J27_03590 [Photobacterium kishitanii]